MIKTSHIIFSIAMAVIMGLHPSKLLAENENKVKVEVEITPNGAIVIKPPPEMSSSFDAADALQRALLPGNRTIVLNQHGYNYVTTLMAAREIPLGTELVITTECAPGGLVGARALAYELPGGVAVLGHREGHLGFSSVFIDGRPRWGGTDIFNVFPNTEGGTDLGYRPYASRPIHDLKVYLKLPDGRLISGVFENEWALENFFKGELDALPTYDPKAGWQWHRYTPNTEEPHPYSGPPEDGGWRGKRGAKKWRLSRVGKGPCANPPTGGTVAASGAQSSTLGKVNTGFILLLIPVEGELQIAEDRMKRGEEMHPDLIGYLCKRRELNETLNSALDQPSVLPGTENTPFPVTLGPNPKPLLTIIGLPFMYIVELYKAVRLGFTEGEHWSRDLDSLSGYYGPF